MNIQAVRAFNRVWLPIAAQLEEAEARDAHFDGGEWSRSAHANLWLEKYDATVERVAHRFDIEPNTLVNDMQEYFYHQVDCQCVALADQACAPFRKRHV